jgi:hypothetical protein
MALALNLALVVLAQHLHFLAHQHITLVAVVALELLKAHLLALVEQAVAVRVMSILLHLELPIQAVEAVELVMALVKSLALAVLA